MTKPAPDRLEFVIDESAAPVDIVNALIEFAVEFIRGEDSD